jgi:hypothetical protein
MKSEPNKPALAAELRRANQPRSQMGRPSGGRLQAIPFASGLQILFPRMRRSWPNAVSTKGSFRFGLENETEL